MTGALVVSIIALVVATVSLTWQFAQFKLTGSRPIVTLQIGARGARAVVTAKARVDFNFEQMASQGYDEPVLEVKIHNRGRTAISVTSWAIAFDAGSSFSFPGWVVNDSRYPLPHRLEAGADCSFLCPLDAVLHVEKGFRGTAKPVRSCRAQAGFGDGREIKSKNDLKLGPAGGLHSG